MMMAEEDIPPPSPFYSLFIKQLEQLENEEEESKEAEDAQESDRRIFQYLAEISAQDDLKVEDYFKDLPWLNLPEGGRLSLHSDLAGLLVVVDFFTYCCINCLHMLPFLEQFEDDLEQSKSSVVLLGVHSPKFESEKPLGSVASALARHHISHPVCNDPGLVLWNALQISCWPTVVLLGPDSRLLFYLVGERAITARLRRYVNASLRFFEASLTGSSVNLRTSNLLNGGSTLAAAATNILHFPTKLALSPSGEKVAVSNSLRHSILVATTADGTVLHTVGADDPMKNPGPGPGGFKDGETLGSALFNSPQGVAWQSEEVLFVCDTGNHAIRRVNLRTGHVETVAGGSGRQSSELNSPWDVVCDAENGRLYIAMAGSHQIWMLNIGDGKEEVPVLRCLAGDGKEEKRNNRFPLKASFAQPSGVALLHSSKEYRRLFIADSESSSVRVLELMGDDVDAGGAGAVSTLVGGGLDPRDLFAFGDVDGVGSKARLQHPMGVCVSGDSLYIADTFNHKIKKVTLSSGHCQAVEIKDTASGLPLSLNEPNGLCFYSEDTSKLLIADTNHHRLVLLDLTSGIGEEFPLHFDAPPDSVDAPSKDLNRRKVQSTEVLYLSAKRPLQVELRFRSFSGGFKTTPEAVQRIQIKETSEQTALLSISPSSLAVTSEQLAEQSGAVQFSVCFTSSATDKKQKNVDSKVPLRAALSILCDLSLCNDVLSCCKRDSLQVDVPVRIVGLGDDNEGLIKDKQCIEIDA